MADKSSDRMAHLPFLSRRDFDVACTQILEAYDKYIAHHDGGTPVPLRIKVQGEEQEAGRFLSLKQSVHGQPLGAADAGHDRPLSAPDEAGDLHGEGDDLLKIDEIDEHVVHSDDVNTFDSIATVEFDVLLSATYQVPVLYFRLMEVRSDVPQGLDYVYQYMVPKESVSQLQQISVMGGIAIQYHPITDLPCFFIHPCNTPDAMRELLGTETVTELQYLQIWLGLIGASVGLHLPKELAVMK